MTTIALLVLLCAAAQVQTPHVTDAASDSARLTQLESLWNAAHLRGDADVLDGLWADDVRVVVPSMAPMSKADALAVLRSGHMKFLRYETSELESRIYRDSAVVTGRLLRAREREGRSTQDDWRFTKVYLRTADGWRVVSYHASEAGP